MNVGFHDERITMTCNLRRWFYLLCVMALAFGCRNDGNAQAKRAELPEDRKVTTVNTENENVANEAIRDVSFTCTLSKGENELIIKYTIKNTGAKDIYVLDAYPRIDPTSRVASADLKSFYLSFKGPSSAIVLKGVPPLPSMPVAVRVMPLGTKVEPNADLSREVVLPMPLRERSDWYYAPLAPEEYGTESVDRIVFNLQFIRSTVECFDAKPAPYAPEFFVVNAQNVARQAETVREQFPIDRTPVFVRKDLFPRL